MIFLIDLKIMVNINKKNLAQGRDKGLEITKTIIYGLFHHILKMQELANKKMKNEERRRLVVN